MSYSREIHQLGQAAASLNTEIGRLTRDVNLVHQARRAGMIENEDDYQNAVLDLNEGIKVASEERLDLAQYVKIFLALWASDRSILDSVRA